jgi:hypothetical protein
MAKVSSRARNAVADQMPTNRRRRGALGGDLRQRIFQGDAHHRSRAPIDTETDDTGIGHLLAVDIEVVASPAPARCAAEVPTAPALGGRRRGAALAGRSGSSCVCRKCRRGWPRLRAATHGR